MVEPTLQSVALGLASAASILKTLKDLVSGDAKAHVTALYDVILTAQSSALEANIKQSAMVETIRDLEKELARVRAWEEQKQRYQLAHMAEGFSAVAYSLKESCKGTEPPHWICTRCYEDGRRSILNYG